MDDMEDTVLLPIADETEHAPSNPSRQEAGVGLSELEARYPRIAEKLVAIWKRPEIERYLNELSLDARGGRAGFSQEVIVEIMLLFNLKSEARGDIWDCWIPDNPYYEELNSRPNHRRLADMF